MRLAAPMPEPMHMLVQMMRAPERFASERAVAIWRAPCLGIKKRRARVKSAKLARQEGKGGGSRDAQCSRAGAIRAKKQKV